METVKPTIGPLPLPLAFLGWAIATGCLSCESTIQPKPTPPATPLTSQHRKVVGGLGKAPLAAGVQRRDEIHYCFEAESDERVRGPRSVTVFDVAKLRSRPAVLTGKEIDNEVAEFNLPLANNRDGCFVNAIKVEDA